MRSLLPLFHEGICSPPALLFSVIVPFLNEERWLSSCLAALRAQTFEADRVEWVFIDNGSTDRSAEIVAADDKAILLREERKDPYLARNTGIRHACGQYLVFLDADCQPDPDWLRVLAHALQAADAEILVGHLAYPATGPALLRLYEGYEDAKLRFVFGEGALEYAFGHAGNMVIRADVFKNHGLFPPMPVVGDTEIIHRLLAHCPKAVMRYVPEARVVHAEVSTLWVFITKSFETGQYSRTMAANSRYRTLSLSLRWHIYTTCVKRYQYTAFEQIGLLGVLCLGWAAFVAGFGVRSLQKDETAVGQD